MQNKLLHFCGQNNYCKHEYFCVCKYSRNATILTYMWVVALAHDNFC